MTNPEISCMLAKNYFAIKPKFPYIAQEKLNGIRAVWLPEYGKFFSRTGKPFNAIPEITESMKGVNIPLDGELYNRNLSCQEINARLSVNRTTPHDDHGRIQFYAFDIYGMQSPFLVRDTCLNSIGRFEVLPRWVAENHNQVLKDLQVYFENGYEGLMLRDPNAPYIHGRTHHLLKVKKPLETTAHIINIVKGESLFKNIMGALEVIERLTGIIFRVGGGFTIEQRKEIWAHPQEYLHREIKVIFAERSLNKTPKQPRFAGFVND